MNNNLTRVLEPRLKCWHKMHKHRKKSKTFEYMQCLKLVKFERASRSGY